MKGTVKHEGSSWYFQVTLGKKTDGSRNQVKTRGFKTEKEAQQALRRAIMEYEDGLYVHPSKMFYKDLAKEYMVYKKPRISSVTYECYSHLFKSIILPFLGEVKLNNIKPQLIYQFYGKMNDDSFAGATRAKVHDLLKDSFQYALNLQHIKISPMETVERPKKGTRDITVWNSEQINEFLSLAENSPYFIVYYIALVTGMRQGEILGLRWEDIDFESGTIFITQTRKTDGKLQYGAKNKSSMRSLTLASSQIDVLLSHYEKQQEQKRQSEDVYSDENLVAASEVGTSINPSNLRRNLKKLISKSNLPSIRFHDLRHTHATLLLTLKQNPKVVAERLGHSNVKTTLDTYSHLLPNVQKEVSSEVAEAIRFQF
ncbi:site-specific integrase [Salisediminibacterium beveridgei]|uniref:Site specific tyrosine recombinase, xerC-like, phage integrase family n=1 Tax=Salisediminibacterium beveridgei TaxID=632773 RepID=A0A1D7QSU3_9BACI|nr:site-specific integrase [Salisediminibacterium beveridgei]AOM82058.1 site specific tyrosine recombinase, xerC-like, phage integrase family [Salisediminibacterium beveridgei]